MALNSLTNAVVNLTMEFKKVKIDTNIDGKAFPIATQELGRSEEGPTSRSGDDNSSQQNASLAATADTAKMMRTQVSVGS